MSKPGPVPVFSKEETMKYERYMEISDINERRSQYMAFSPAERDRYKLWVEVVSKPRQELRRKEIQESRRRQEEHKQKLVDIDLKIENMQTAKQDLFVQFGSKIATDLDKIKILPTSSGRTVQKSIKH